MVVLWEELKGSDRSEILSSCLLICFRFLGYYIFYYRWHASWQMSVLSLVSRHSPTSHLPEPRTISGVRIGFTRPCSEDGNLVADPELSFPCVLCATTTPDISIHVSVARPIDTKNFSLSQLSASFIPFQSPQKCSGHCSEILVHTIFLFFNLAGMF